MTEVDQPYQQRQLASLVRSYEEVERAQLTHEEARELLRQVNELNEWLRAECYYRDNVQRWLLTEKRWKLTQELISKDSVYGAAARGWAAMREVCVNLDGVDDFSQLSPILRDRYALFAAAVLNEPFSPPGGAA